MYKFLNAEGSAVVHLPTSRCIYLDQPSTIHHENYIKWRDGWTDVIPAWREVVTAASTETKSAWIEKLPDTDPPQYVEHPEEVIQHVEVAVDHEQVVNVYEPHEADAYVAPPILRPAPITHVLMVQARKALILEGVSLIEIEAIIDKMPGIQRDLARADWDTAPNVHRDNALVAYIAKTKSWPVEFVDALFVKAAGIKA